MTGRADRPRRAAPGPLPRARRRFGQHFLEPAWVLRLIDAVAPATNETFVEIGPGRGALTVPLAARAGRVIAIEIDRDLATRLASTAPPNVEVRQGDILKTDVAELTRHERTPVRVVGNLPYNVASPILFRLLHTAADGRVLQDATVMLQREVAARVMAAPGTGDYGALAIQVGLSADVELLFGLPPGAFRPPPRVHSSVIRLRFRPPLADVGDRAVFERLVRGLFRQRRKMLLNALKPVAASFGRGAPEIVERLGLDGQRRPETLTIHEMARLSRAML